LAPVVFEGSSVPANFTAPEGSPVAQHGHLRVDGSRLLDGNGQPVRLRGMSLFWSQWGSKYWTADVVDWLRSDWNISLLRAPMGVESGGYLESHDLEKQRVVTVVDAAIRAGIYVIIDWHDHHAERHTGRAHEFFEEMAQVYGHFPNVLFEIFNEPLKESWHDDIKAYEQEIVDSIRKYSDNVIICGTRQWSQDVDVAAADPLVGGNLTYTLHFYAAYHKEALREKARAALSMGVALFASEWGTCSFDGDGWLDLEETNKWLEFLEEHNISDANWAVNDKEEACSALLPGASSTGGWGLDKLTDSGRFVRSSLRGSAANISGGSASASEIMAESTLASMAVNLQTALVSSTPGCAGDIENCKASRCCATPGYTCFEKDEFWASCKATCTPGVNPDDPPEVQSPWSCAVLAPVVFEGSSVPANFTAPEGSPVAQHGHLRVDGSRLLDGNGQPVRLRGMSLFWSQWGSKYWTADVVDWLRSDWNISLLRAPMGVESGGYLESHDLEKQRVVTVVDAAIRAGIYVIIDWHDHHAERHTGRAHEFFEEMAQVYGHFPNVLFEIFNEPLKESWHDDIKAYEQEIVDSIRKYSDNVIICGTRQWSQDVDVAAADPLVGGNLTYTLHFYAAYHKEALREKARAALSMGVALFASEWGTCSFDGDGWLDLEETNKWLEFLEEHNISDANWAVNDKEEACSALLPGASSTGGWGLDKLTDSGRFVRSSLREQRDEVRNKVGASDRFLSSTHSEIISGAFQTTFLSLRLLLAIAVTLVAIVA